MTDPDPQSASVSAMASRSTNDLRSNLSQLLKNERLVVSVVLCVLVIFSILDFVEDRAGGASAVALFSDISDAFLPLFLLLYIWRFKPFFQAQQSAKLEIDLVRKEADLQHWKTTAAGYISGLSESIDMQLNSWSLTRAEKEVALLLLKGFSLQELADVRGTSERTVRQQATRIYEKAGLRGRAELSAFFLEDLMLPTTDD